MAQRPRRSARDSVFIPSGISLALLLYCAPASAAPPSAADNIAASDMLFLEGKELMRAERFGEACEKLAESYQLEASGRTILYLGACHKAEGKSLIAWSELQDAARVARLDKRKDREGAALTLLGELSEESPKISLALDAATASLGGLKVSIDGIPIAREHWGVGVPVDPGGHTIVASAPHCLDERTTVHVKNAATTTVIQLPELHPSLKVILEVDPSAPDASTRRASQRVERERARPQAGRDLSGGLSGSLPQRRLPASPDKPSGGSSSSPSQFLRPASWDGQGSIGAVFSVLGVLGLVVGPALGVHASNLSEDADAYCHGSIGCSEEGDALHKDAARYSDLSAASLIIGGIAAAAGGITLTVFAARHARRPAGTASASARFSFQAGGQGVSLAGQF